MTAPATLFPLPRVDIDAIVTALATVRVTRAGQPETALHDALAEALSAARIGFRREHGFAAGCRADLWVDGIVIEVKIGRMGRGDTGGQLHRYACHDVVRGLILVTERGHWPATEIAGKPLRIISLQALWSIAV